MHFTVHAVSPFDLRRADYDYNCRLPIIPKPLPNYPQIILKIVLKPVNGIRFFRLLKVSNKYYNIITTWSYIPCVT